MKQLFNITATAPQAADLLICELSHYHICLAGADAGGNIHWLEYYEDNTPLTQADVSELLRSKEAAIKHSKSLFIGSAFPDATLVPRQLAEEKGLDTFIKKSGAQNVFIDTVADHDLQVVYSIPSHFYEALQVLGQTRIMHVHSAAIKTQTAIATNYMSLHFTSKEFRVLAVKNGQVQLAQIYPFTAPLDVVYYLLMISAQYNMPQEETTIILSGLLDESSALYKELYQYYTQVQLAAPGTISLPKNDYQPYYFSSIFNIAACASLVVS